MPARVRAILATVILAAAALLGAGSPALAGAAAPRPFVIEGLDLHDATVKRFGNRYYMYGSMYACGFEWYVNNTPWCGFGVSTASRPQGPWSAPKPLFAPDSEDPYAKRSWQATCGGTGQGCFNPRMIQRTGWGLNDGAFLLWFNAPRHHTQYKVNAYNVMTCAGPAGPCGPAAANGTYTKPVLDVCAGNGDFGIIERAGTRPAIVCTMPGETALNIEELNTRGDGGTGVGVQGVAGLTHIEGPGGFWNAAHRTYVLTYSDQGCGYCAGTPTSYATAPSLYSGWTAPGNVGWGAPVYGRRVINGTSCGGQPRTVTVLDGQPWQIVDLWRGTRNEAQAGTLLAPLSYHPTPGTPGDGKRWIPPVSYSCS
ncbi:hypothetical protein AB0E88_09145 [Streptomyces sp. NPDC028635]|uniref:hypothetical protein n=1 Tax=Streptomyces sp. NPDC028635 TaxID=3154800 RepID=UPI0033CC7503